MNPTISTAKLLETARDRIPAIDGALGAFGRMPIRSYLGRIQTVAPETAQPKDDFLDVVGELAQPVLGRARTRAAVKDLAAQPVVLTANHLGIECFAQSLQSILLFSLRPGQNGHKPGSVPIFSFGNVPLNNLTYPRGLLVYGSDDHRKAPPLRVPIFPDRFKGSMAGSVAGFDRPMVERATKRMSQLSQKKVISPRMAATVNQVINDICLRPEIVASRRFSDQAAHINTRLWRQLFENPDRQPDLLYLEVEKIVARLLADDLNNPASLAAAVLWEPHCRNHLLDQLDGQPGCWHLQNLRPADREQNKPGGGPKSPRATGTLFFWGTDARGRRIPLRLVRRSRGRLFLCGLRSGIRSSIRNREDLDAIPWTPPAITEALSAGRLVPSMFTCFMTLAFARGITCLGGYFQGQYLPRMQQGLVRALKAGGAAPSLIKTVNAVPAAGYLSGMLGVMSQDTSNGSGHRRVPAGPLEIIAGGRLSCADLQRLSDMTVETAHLAGLWETLTDLTSSKQQRRQWQDQLTQSFAGPLDGKLVVKDSV